MAKKIYVRNNDNTEWVPLATSIPNASAYATYEYVDNELGNIDLISTINTASAAAVTYLVDSAPETLNTLNELSAALNDDANFASTISTSLGNKLDISGASSTYLTQTSADSTYLTKTSATTTYVNKNVGGLNLVIPTSATNGTVGTNGIVTFSGVSSLTVNGCFSSTYQNYKILFSTSAGQANVELRLQLTSGGTSNTGSYLCQPSGGVGSTVESSFPLTFIQYNGVVANEFSLLQPALSVHTQYVTDWNYDDGGSIIYRKMGGKHRVNTSYDGFVISGATTMTGTIRIYGYNNGS
jgi:hypothetical protein